MYLPQPLPNQVKWASRGSISGDCDGIKKNQPLVVPLPPPSAHPGVPEQSTILGKALTMLFRIWRMHTTEIGKFSRFGSAVLTGQGKRATIEDSLQLQLLTKFSSLYWAELMICEVAGFKLL